MKQNDEDEIKKKIEFEEKIRAYIRQDGRSQAAIARKLGYRADRFNKWLNGINKMPIIALQKFCELLNLDTSIRTELFSLAGYVISLTNQDGSSRQDDTSSRHSNVPDVFSEQYAGREIADHVQGILQLHTKVFTGRTDELKWLNTFITENQSGVLVITAKAGFGKTTFLANWLMTQSDERHLFSYHFFNSLDDLTRDEYNAYRNLVRQLYRCYKLNDKPLPSDTNTLRDLLYSLVQDHEAFSDKPLIIVLDGLDEAKNTFPLPFPAHIPNGVFIILSVRADKDEKPEYLRSWIETGQRLHLTRLPHIAIADYLRQSHNHDLERWIQDENFVAQVDEVTEGFPLYLQYITEELVQAAKAEQDWYETLLRIPIGFKTYVNLQVQDLDSLILPEQIWSFFALLAIAKGALNLEEIKEVTGMRNRDLRQMRKLWQVTRWLHITERENTALYTFTHPVLAETFAEILYEDSKLAKSLLLTFCNRWKEHRSSYALQYYAEHLREAKHYDELFSLARNSEFWQLQEEVLPQDPDLPLRTVYTALLAADQTNNVSKMAEFTLLQARRLQNIRKESPLDALRSGKLQRAWELANLFEMKLSILWFLLLAWELHEHNQPIEAKATLERMQERALSRLPILEIRQTSEEGWQDAYIAILIAHTLDVNKEVFTTLESKLLAGGNLPTLCQELIRIGHIDDALETAERYGSDAAFTLIATDLTWQGNIVTAREVEKRIRTDFYRVKVLCEIVASCTEAEKSESIKALFAIVTRLVQELNESNRRDQNELSSFLWRLVGNLALQGEIDSALIIAKEIGDHDPGRWLPYNSPFILEKPRLEALSDLAVAQAFERDFLVALQTVEQIDDDWWRVRALTTIALELRKAGKREDSSSIFDIALQTAQLMNNDYWRKDHTCWQAMALSMVAKAQFKGGDRTAGQAALELAIQKVKDIDIIQDQDAVLEAIAKVQAEEGNIETALGTVEAINNKYKQAEMLRVVGLVSAKRNELDVASTIFNSAIETAKNISSRQEQAIVFARIASSLGRNYGGDAERSTYATAFQSKSSIEENEVRTSVIEETARILALSSDFKSAIHKTQEISDKPKRVSVLVEVAKIQIKANLQDAGLLTLDSAIIAAKAINDEMRCGEALKAIAETQAQAGDITAAIRTADQIYIPDQDQLADAEWLEEKTFVEIAYIIANKGDQATIRQLVTRINNPGRQAQMQRLIASVEAQLGEIIKSLQIAGEIEDEWWRTYAFLAIAKKQREKGDQEGANSSLNTALQIAQGMTNSWSYKGYKYPRWYEEAEYRQWHAVLLANVAQTQVEFGDREHAETTLSSALRIAMSIHDKLYYVDGRTPKAEALRIIAEIYATMGDKITARVIFSEALTAAQEIQDQQVYASAQKRIACSQAQVGYGEDAVQTVEAIQINRDKHLIEVASILANKGDSKNLKRLLKACSNYLHSGIAMCRCLAMIYHEQAKDVAIIVTHGENHSVLGD